MPHNQRHRGAQSEDARIFHKAYQGVLQDAVFDYSFLLTRGYGEAALFKLVGDRYQLTQRQRYAVMRAACSNQSLEYRQAHEAAHLQNKPYLVIDGFNLLITLESALSGGCLFEGRDGCYRDLASLHSSYKRVMETLPAIDLIGQYCEHWEWPPLYWYLDRPVSNSGKLKAYLDAEAEKNGWPWQVSLVNSPDYELKRSTHPVVTTDSYILDNASEWVNLARWLIQSAIPEAWVVSLKPQEDGLRLCNKSTFTNDHY